MNIHTELYAVKVFRLISFNAREFSKYWGTAQFQPAVNSYLRTHPHNSDQGLRVTVMVKTDINKKIGWSCTRIEIVRVGIISLPKYCYYYIVYCAMFSIDIYFQI